MGGSAEPLQLETHRSLAAGDHRWLAVEVKLGPAIIRGLHRHHLRLHYTVVAHAGDRLG